MANIINVIIKDAETPEDDIIVPDTGWYTSSTESNNAGSSFVAPFIGIGVISFALLLILMFAKRKWKRISHFGILSILAILGIGVSIYGIIANSRVSASDNLISITSSDTTITVVRGAEGAETDTTYGVATATIKLNETTPLGYTIFAYTPDGNILAADTGEGTIEPVAINNSALTNNTWGIALTDQADIKAEDAIWNKLDDESNPLLVTSFDESTTAGRTITLRYGVLVDNTLPVGVYSANIEYKAYQRAYNITFDPGEGEITTPTKPVIIGEPIGELPTPVRTNYNFLGWYTAETGGTKIDENTVPDQNSTYFAHWERITYSITFNPGEGTIISGDATKTVQAGEPLGTLPEAARDNYTFTGWYTQETGGERVTTATIPTAGTSYYAHWSRDTYTITFNAGEGTIDQQDAERSINAGDAIGTLPEATRTNYTLDGWYTAETGGTKIDAGTTPTASTTYYARWIRIEYTITYNLMGGNIAGDTANPTAIVQAGDTLSNLPQTPSKTNYTFAGWYTAETGGDPVTTETRPDGTTTYFARWDRIEYTITFDLNGGNISGDTTNPTATVQAGDTLGNLPAEPSKDNHTFAGWWTNETGGTQVTTETRPDSTTTYFAHWNRIEYTITFDLNGGNIGGDTTNPTTTVQAGDSLGTLPSEPTRTNYTFAGWYTQLDGGTPIDANITPTGTTTYFAHWNRIEYEITFDLNGGNIGGDTTNPTATVYAGDTLGNLPTDPTKDDFVFAGWWTAAEGGTQVTIATEPTGTTTYFAHWTVAIITVTFNANGGTLVGGGSTTTRDVNAGSPLGALPEVTRNEYTLAGWYTDANGGVRVTPDSIPSDGDTYYAHWEENNFPKVWSHDGACTFNATVSGNKTSSSPLGLTGDQCDYAGQDYIDTGIQLYSNTNHGKDYEIGFTIESYDPDENVKQATFMNTKLEGNSYPGAVVRRYDLNNNIDISSRNTSSANIREFVDVNTPMTIRLVRKDSISNPGYKAIYYAIDDDELTEINDLSNFNPEFNLNVWFGATPTNASATSAQRYLNGVMSNMYIRLGEYNEGSADTYTINFNAQGGTTLEPTRTIIAGYKLDTLPAPTRAGYVFDGWYTQASGGTKISENTIPSGGTTYYARWISKYTIIYNANGRTFADDSTINKVEYTGGTATGTYKEPVGTNTYIFMGWGTASTDTSATYTSEEQVKTYYSANPGQTVTLYAVWANALTISFDGNGSTEGTMDTIYVPANTTQTLPANAFAKDGYVFTNWSTNDDGTGTTYSNKGSITVGAVTPGDTLTLYANWGVSTTFDDAYAAAGKSKDTTSDKYKMHEMTPAICEAVTTGQTSELVDVRDGTVYHVGKLADDRCWLLDNLALDAVTSKANLAPENTNASQAAINNFITDSGTAPQAGWATTAVSYETSSSVNNQPRIIIASKNVVPQGSDPLASFVSSGDWKVGVYYNYCAASIGTYCYAGSGVDTDSTSAIDVKNDICPAGWRMPTGGAISSTGTTAGGGEYQALYNAYPAISGGDNQYTRFRKAFRLPLSGIFSNGSPYHQGSYAYVWSSTFPNGYSMYLLLANTSDIYPQNRIDRYFGFSVRCVADNVTKNLVTFNANGGIVDGGNTTAYKVTKGQTLGTLPEATRDGYVLDGWYTQIDGGEEVTEQTVPAGAIIYYAHWSVAPTTFDDAYAAAGKSKDTTSDRYKIHEMTPAICEAVTIGQTGELVDVRDGTVYHVGKLADDRCWLLDNLALDAVASKANLAPENTNASQAAIDNYITSSGTAPQAGWATTAVSYETSFSVHNQPRINIASKNVVPQGSDPLASFVSSGDWKVGIYYNYCAASIGTYCYANGSGVDTDSTSAIDVKNDICPAGWRMPTGGAISSTGTTAGGGEYQALYNAYPAISGGDNQYTRFRKAFRLPLSGSFDDGSPYNQGSYAFVWSSTFYNGGNMYDLNADTSGIYPQYNNSRYDGFSVRCVADNVTKNLITFNANGGIVDGGNTTAYKVTKGQALGTLPEATRDGYTFDGWYTAMDGGTEVTSQTIPAGAITYYAHWNEIITTFDDAYAAADKSRDATSGKYTLQDMDNTICSAVSKSKANDYSDTQETQLVDLRDGKVYWVAKLLDGKCWMTQNLDLDLIHTENDSDALYTHENTDLGWGSDTTTVKWNPERTTVPASSISSSGTITQTLQSRTHPYSVDTGDWYWIGNWNNNGTDTWYESGTNNYLNRDNNGAGDKFSTNPYEGNGEHGHVGNYYNWTAAIASNNSSNYDPSITTYSDITGNPQNSICPAGWRLPTISNDDDVIGSTNEFRRLVTLYGDTASNDKAFTASPLWFVRSGWTDGSEWLYYSGHDGVYWSSTLSGNIYIYDFIMSPSSVFPEGGVGDRRRGYSVRCVARDMSPTNLITFNANGGVVEGGSTTTRRITEGQTLGTLPEATRDGYVLDGWYTQIEAGEEVTSQTVPAGAITYYAHWSLPPTTFDDAYTAAGKSRDAASGKYKIQDMNKNICDAVSTSTKSDYSDTQETQLVDIRDGKTYWVAKLLDGKCWMTQNLDYDLDSSTALVHASSDIGWGSDTSAMSWTPERSTIPVSDISSTGSNSGWSNDTNNPYSIDTGDWYWIGNWNNDGADTWYSSIENIYLAGNVGENPVKFKKNESFSGNSEHGHVGNYYNWTAAIASNNSTSYNSSTLADITTNPQNSICPAGWRLPTISNASDTDGSTNEFRRLVTLYGNTTGDDKALTASPLWFVRGGCDSDTRLWGSGFNSGYWSSTVRSKGYAYDLFFRSNDVYPENYADRDRGWSVRCVARDIVPDPDPNTTTFDEAYSAAKMVKDTTTDKYKLQDMTTSICGAITTGQTSELVDVRDGTVYHVGKLADDRCWLLDNLVLNAVASKTNLTPENTNASQAAINNFITSSGTAPQAGWATTAVSYETSSSAYDQPRINAASKTVVPYDALSTNDGWKVGIYYNYCAASIGTYCYAGDSGVDTDSTSAIDVKNDICPAGWRMPTGGAISSTGTDTGGGEYQALYDAYPAISGGDTQYTRFRKAFRLPLSGYFYNGSPSGQGSSASVWSSTFYDGNHMHNFYASTSSISPQNSGYRYYGRSVRCVAK